MALDIMYLRGISNTVLFLYIYCFSLYIKCYLFNKEKEYKSLGKYLLVHVIPAIIGIVFYPVSIYQIFFSYRGLGASDTGRSLITNLKYYSDAILKMFNLEK